MAWSWSHTQEAYVAAERNLRAMPKETLEVIFAEWRAAQGKHGVINDHDRFNERKYERALAHAKKLDAEQLADFIWERASEYATCDNGGHKAWMCPSGCGCHTVDFSVTLETIKAEYEPLILDFLERIRKQLAEAGQICGPVDDLTGDEYQWGFILHRDPLPEPEQIGKWREQDISFDLYIVESEPSDGTENGINFRLQCGSSAENASDVSYMLYNYTEKVWVDIGDEEAVAERWREFVANFDLFDMLAECEKDKTPT